MPKSIDEQVIVVAGGSSGIGLATARDAARRGAKVVLAARNAADLDRAVEELCRDGGEAIAVPTDMTDPAQVEALGHRAVDAYGRVDTWVNCAGVSAYATFEEQSPEDFRQVIEVDFFGQVNGARVALPLLDRTDGALVCVGSALSDRGVPLQGAYCAAKHALKGWLDSLRVELMHRGSNIRVTLVKPSSINTPLFNKARTQMGVMPRPIPPVYEPELAAAAILRAAEGDERDVYVGGAGKLLALAERVSPRLADAQQRRMSFDSQRTDWPRSADAPSNLYQHVAHDGGMRGDFGGGAADRSYYQAVAARPVVASMSAAVALGLGAVALERMSGRRALPVLLAVGALMLTGRGARAVRSR
ncbi:MAG: SDR family oxidoreductase [Gemmatimonadaceae bacterium]